MRSFRRILTSTALAAAITAGGLAVAGPAAASPEDGQGCAGLPSIPASYVCVISTNPGAVVPTVTTTPTIPVTVPSVCYVAGCTAATTVNVPRPSVTPGTGAVAVIWYQGVSYPIGAGTVDALMPLVVQAEGIVLGAAGTVLGIAGGYVDLVNRTIEGLPSAGELVDAVVTLVVNRVTPYVEAVEEIVNNLPTTKELVNAAKAYIDEQVQPYLDLVAQIVDALPEVIAYVRDRVAEVREAIDRIPEDFAIACITLQCLLYTQ